jgi:phosphonoacetaldehyde hydrolase
MRKNGRTGKESGIAAVIFDWAGTIVDFGCFAPTISIVETFAGRGVEISLAEARGPMGLEKREHLRRLLEDERIRGQWKTARATDPTPEDADALYAELEPRLAEAVKARAELVPGARELADELRSWGIRIGTTTGYLRPLMDILVGETARQGFSPDCVVCPSEVPAGRPFPWMCFMNAISLNAFPLDRIVKIGDTPADMQEGVNAGMWTIGVTLSGNEIGLSALELSALSPEEQSSRHKDAGRRLVEAGAHYVAESVGTCRGVLARIEERILKGEHPGAPHP